MAVNIVLPAGLLVFLCVLAVTTGTSPTVPDGVVDTEVKKTLVRGLQGKLTCHFYGEPWAVYWKRGYDPMDLDLMLVWHIGDVSGPRYDDGSCDIDDTFSLIMHNVSVIDAGRIYCIVSNYQGILLENYTDVSVTDTAIDTKPQVILEMGSGRLGILQCTVHIKARRVSWRRKTASSTKESLVVLENNENNVAEISGAGYDQGMYNITGDYTLIIKNLHVRHEGLYVCEATDFDTGMSFRNHTFVSVFAKPLMPFPTVQECMNFQVQYDPHYCTLEAKSEMTLTCQVMEYYPDINLFFLHGLKVVEPFEKTEWNNTDGTKNKTVKIAARESKELYTCVASNIPGSDGRMSTSVLLQDEDTFNSFRVIVLVCVAALLTFSIMAYLTWRRKHRHSDSNHDYTEVGQDEREERVERVELQHYDDKDVKDLTLEEYQDLLERVDDALMKNYRRIYDLIDTKSTLQAEKIIDENKTALFNTEQMLKDWRQNPESTYRQYTKAMETVISTEDTSDHAWPSNDELRWISRHLNQESMKEICKKLKITYKIEDADVEGNRYNSWREWRNKVAHENIEKKHNLLSSAIGSKKFRGLLPPLKGGFIYKAELVDIAFNLLMQDLLPIAEALGINATKLVSYRRVIQPSHLKSGTIGLLSKLLNSTTEEFQKFLDKGNLRIFFFTRMGKLAYRNVATCGMVAYDMSYGELYAIKEAMASTKLKAGVQALQSDTSKVPTQSEDNTGKKDAASEIPEDGKKEAMAFITEKGGVQALPGDTSKASTQSENGKYEKGASPSVPHDANKEEGIDIGKFEGEKPQAGLVQEPEKAVKDTENMDQRAVEIPKDLVDLQRVLQLTDQDIVDGLGSSNPITACALFRIWKEMPRPSVFNYRASLAHELRRIQYPNLADDVIAGKYIKKQTSLEFIQNMVQGLNQEQLRILGKLLELSGKDEQWHTRTPFDVISKQICEWVTNWTKQMKKPGNVVTAGFPRVVESFQEVSPISTTSKKHKDLNDRLVEQGFLELAREIMIIELVE